MFSIQVVTRSVDMFRMQWLYLTTGLYGASMEPLWRCLYALGVDALACTVRSWMKLTLTSLCSLNEYTIDILDWLCLLCARILRSWPSLPVWKWISTLLQKFKLNNKLLLWSSVCNPIDMFLNSFFEMFWYVVWMVQQGQSRWKLSRWF
jgi:hypothetical protein